MPKANQMCYINSPAAAGASSASGAGQWYLPGVTGLNPQYQLSKPNSRKNQPPNAALATLTLMRFPWTTNGPCRRPTPASCPARRTQTIGCISRFAQDGIALQRARRFIISGASMGLDSHLYLKPWCSLQRSTSFTVKKFKWWNPIKGTIVHSATEHSVALLRPPPCKHSKLWTQGNEGIKTTAEPAFANQLDMVYTVYIQLVLIWVFQRMVSEAVGPKILGLSLCTVMGLPSVTNR